MKHYVVSIRKLFHRRFYTVVRTLNDSQEIANAFNTYFISIGPKLATQTNANHHFTAYLDDPSGRRLKLVNR